MRCTEVQEINLSEKVTPSVEIPDLISEKYQLLGKNNVLYNQKAFVFGGRDRVLKALIITFEDFYDI